MVKSTIFSLISGVAMTGLGSTTLLSSGATAPFHGYSQIAEKQVVLNTIRQGGSGRYSSGYYYRSRSSSSSGGYSFGK